MRPATIVGGVLGGLLTTALLIPSLYLDVPHSLIVDWASSRTMGLVASLLALGALVATGMAGAAASPDRQARAGTLAGILAAFVALTIVLPAGGVLGHGDLVELVEGGRATTDNLKRAIVLSTMHTPAYQTGAVAILLGSGALMGWLGGVIHDLWRGTPSRKIPAIRPSPVPWIGLAVLVLSVLQQLGALVAMETFVFSELGATTTWAGRAQVTTSLALGGAIAALLCAMITRDAVLIWRRRNQRVRAGVWMLAQATLLLLILGMAVTAYWQVLLLPGAIAGAMMVAAAPIVGLFLGWRSPMDVETSPRIFQDVLGEALFAGVLCGGIVGMHGLSAAVTYAMLARPYQQLLTDGATKVATDPLGEAIHQLYLVHLGLPTLMLLATFAYLVVAVPVWLVSRMIRG